MSCLRFVQVDGRYVNVSHGHIVPEKVTRLVHLRPHDIPCRDDEFDECVNEVGPNGQRSEGGTCQMEFPRIIEYVLMVR